MTQNNTEDPNNMNSRCLWRVRGPWSNDDWLLASDIPAAEMESREKCTVTLVHWPEENRGRDQQRHGDEVLTNRDKLVVRGDFDDDTYPDGDVYELPDGHRYEMGVTHECGHRDCPANISQ